MRFCNSPQLSDDLKSSLRPAAWLLQNKTAEIISHIAKSQISLYAAIDNNIVNCLGIT
jgi:hypothetical protein